LNCFDCGKILSKSDLQAASCQTCGEPIMPDDINKLRVSLGIEAQKPPEIIQPVVNTSPIEIPDSFDCPDCSTPLIGIDLERWNTEGICKYCGYSNQNTPRTQTITPRGGLRFVTDDEFATLTTGSTVFKVPASLENSLKSFIINVGPMCGQIIDLKIGEIGRSDFKTILTDSWYDEHVARISAEHFMIDEFQNITDLGSTNKTYIDGERISGTTPTHLPIGSALNIGGNIQLSRCVPGGIQIEHNESGVKWHPEDTQAIHLGRHKSNGQEEPWVKMADLQLRAMGKDSNILSYISREHIKFKNRNSTIIKGSVYTLEVPNGKEKPRGWPVNSGEEDDFTLSLNKNSFRITFLNGSGV